MTISIPPLQFDVVERKPRGQLQDCGRAKWDWVGEPFAYGCGQDRRARHGRSAWSGKVRIVARARDIYTMLAIALCWCSERLPRREFLVAVGRRLPRETSPYGDAKARPARLPRSESPDAGHGTCFFPDAIKFTAFFLWHYQVHVIVPSWHRAVAHGTQQCAPISRPADFHCACDSCPPIESRILACLGMGKLVNVGAHSVLVLRKSTAMVPPAPNCKFVVSPITINDSMPMR